MGLTEVIKTLIRMHITAKYFDNVYDLEVEPTDSLLSLRKKISVFLPVHLLCIVDDAPDDG